MLRYAEFHNAQGASDQLCMPLLLRRRIGSGCCREPCLYFRGRWSPNSSGADRVAAELFVVFYGYANPLGRECLCRIFCHRPV